MWSGRVGRWLGTDPAPGLLLAALVLLLQAGTDAFGVLDRQFHDAASLLVPSQPAERITLVAIDDASIARLGRWPLRHGVHADLLDRLSAAGAHTVIEAIDLSEPQDDQGLATVRQLRQGLARRPGVPAEWASLLDQAESRLDMDGRLARSIAAAGNVVLSVQLDPGEPEGAQPPLPAWAARSALAGEAGQPVRAGRWPLPAFGQAAAGVGHVNQFADASGRVREMPLLLDWGNQSVPSLALLAAARSLDLPADALRLRGQAVQLGRLRLRMDEAGHVLPNFQPPRGGRAAYATESFAEVLAGRVPLARLRGQVVIVGLTGAAAGPPWVTATGQQLAPAQLLAQEAASILAGQAGVRPGWGPLLAWALALLALPWIAFGLPRLPGPWPAVTTAGCVAVLLLGEAVLSMAGGLWLPLVLPAAVLATGFLGLWSRRLAGRVGGKLRSVDDSAETNRLMALALQGQGQLDRAFEHFRKVPLGELVMANLYNLGQDYERRRQFAKAQAVYELIASRDPGWRDLAERLPRTRALAEVVTLGTGMHPGASLLLAAAGVEKPMLGRYQVEKELGKGAMGIVYGGRDPKIGRVVAIKTLAKSPDPADSANMEARERFFHEAEIAGRLQHPHIVTIYDAGEEEDLAYIAMEFLQGRDLMAHTRKPNLLPVPRAVSIVARVAQALSYAHRQGVIHRDIKPANIMYEPEADIVKVTDFGIARDDDSAKTKTGVMLGTPSFMSPEQVAGRKLDGRADVYSLGVTLFQLLSGALPYRGETLAELLYKVANEPPQDLRALCSELPSGLAEAVLRAMARDPDERFPTADAFAQALRALLAGADDPTFPGAGAPEAPGEFERTSPGIDVSA